MANVSKSPNREPTVRSTASRPANTPDENQHRELVTFMGMNMYGNNLDTCDGVIRSRDPHRKQRRVHQGSDTKGTGLWGKYRRKMVALEQKTGQETE